MLALILPPLIATTLAAAEQALPASAYALAYTLESSLAGGGLEQPQFLFGILQKLGLPRVQDVRLLNVPEQLELAESLRKEGVNLGSRSKLRQLSEKAIEPGDEPAPEDALHEKSRARHRKTPGAVRLEREGGKNEQRRHLQSGGGGFSIEVAAIAFTGLIGMVGYAVQARSTQKASTAQGSLGREAAEREKAEAKAGKQLERVQLQMAEWVRPLNVNSTFLYFGWTAIARECKLLDYLGLYSNEFVPQPATPYIELHVNTNPAMVAAYGRAPYAQLPPEDLALLAADPALRSRYCELATTVLLPPLRRLSVVFATKFQHYESLAPSRLDPLLPGIGRDWASLVGTLALLYMQLPVYAGQFESLVARWEEERFDLLQPDTPGLHIILVYMSVEQLNPVNFRFQGYRSLLPFVWFGAADERPCKRPSKPRKCERAGAPRGPPRSRARAPAWPRRSSRLAPWPSRPTGRNDHLGGIHVGPLSQGVPDIQRVARHS